MAVVMSAGANRTITCLLMMWALGAAAGCGGGAPQPPPPAPLQAGALQDDDALVEVVSEGSIEAIDQPSFTGAEQARDFMRPEEPVLGVVVEGKARAYSLWFLDRHEVVNDRAGRTPVLVAWCPLAQVARVFRRETAGRSLTFAVSGRLWRNALVLRDRETGSLWSQVSGSAISGPLAGAGLSPIAATIAPWSEWRRLHPEGLVLRKPPLAGSLYARYLADPEKVGFYGQKRRDPRLAPKIQVIGLECSGRALAIPLEALRRSGIWNDRVGDQPVVLVSLGPEGPEYAYASTASGRTLTLEPAAGAGQARDRETGSVWDLATGRGVEGPLAGRSLEPLAALRAYWFIWSAYHPDSDLRHEPPG
jgi:hypothetical protein